MNKTEIVIGTSEEPVSIEADALARRGEGEEMQEDSEEVVEPVPIAEMEMHMARLRQTILFTSPVPPTPAPMFQNARIDASEIERVEVIDDLLDTVLYWVTEESSTFLEEPSQLAQVEAPEVITFCLFSSRPRLIQKALVITELMLVHPQTASELHRAVGQYFALFPVAEESTETTEGKGNWCEGTALFRHAVRLLRAYEGLPELVAAATRVVTKLSVVEGAEVLLKSEAVSLVLSSIVSHLESSSVHLSSVVFFATIVDLPRDTRDVAAEADQSDTSGSPPLPLAVLFCHSEELVPLVLQVLRLGWTQLSIKQSCLHFIRACSRYPENRLRLVQSEAIVLAMRALPELLHGDPEILEETLEIVSFGIPFLDPLQMRGVLRSLHTIIQKRGELEVLLRAVALLYSILLLQRANTARRQEEATPTASPSTEKHETASRRFLCWSPMQRHPDPDKDTIMFLHELAFPPVLIHLVDFYGPSGMDSEDAEELVDRGVELQLASVARRCVQELIQQMPIQSPY